VNSADKEAVQNMDPTSLLQNMQQRAQFGMDMLSFFAAFYGLGMFLIGVGCVIAAVAYWRKTAPAINYPTLPPYTAPPQPQRPPTPPEVDLDRKYGPPR
jgi:hypothetical protein